MSVFGRYELGSAFVAMNFEFRHDSTSTYEQFYDIGGWQAPIDGKFRMAKDTIILAFPASVLQDTLEYPMLKGWRLLFDGNRIYHYSETGVFNRDYPLRRVTGSRKH